MQLNENVYRVSYAGYGIPQSECDEYAIMRAAEITRERGYKYFRLLDEKQSSQASSYYIPGATISHGSATGVGNTVYANTTSYSTGIAGTVHRPVSTITIEVLEEKGNDVGTMNADIIWNSLAKKHDVQSKAKP